MFRSQDYPQGATLFFARDDLRIETCRSDFKCFNVKFYVSAFVG